MKIIPDDVILDILGYLDMSDLLILKSTSKMFYEYYKKNMFKLFKKLINNKLPGLISSLDSLNVNYLMKGTCLLNIMGFNVNKNSDINIGIDRYDIRKVFDHFYNLDSWATRIYEDGNVIFYNKKTGFCFQLRNRNSIVSDEKIGGVFLIAHKKRSLLSLTIEYNKDKECTLHVPYGAVINSKILKSIRKKRIRVLFLTE